MQIIWCSYDRVHLILPFGNLYHCNLFPVEQSHFKCLSLYFELCFHLVLSPHDGIPIHVDPWLPWVREKSGKLVHFSRSGKLTNLKFVRKNLNFVREKSACNAKFTIEIHCHCEINAHLRTWLWHYFVICYHSFIIISYQQYNVLNFTMNWILW